MRTVELSDATASLSDYARTVRKETVVVTRNGKPAAVLINYDEYERLKETLDVLSDPVSMRQIAQSKRFYSKTRRGKSYEALFDEPLIPGTRRKR